MTQRIILLKIILNLLKLPLDHLVLSATIKQVYTGYFWAKMVSRINTLSIQKKEILKIAEKLRKDNQQISMSLIKEFAKTNNVNIEKINYGTIVKTIKENGFEFISIFDKNKFAERRIEMAMLTRQGWTLQKIADKYGITKQAVSLLLKKAASKDGQIVVKMKKSNNKIEKNVIFVRRCKENINTCGICGKKFDGKRKTCGKDCLKKLHESKVGGDWSRVEKINLTCSYCSKEFSRTKYIHKVVSTTKGNADNNYCSRVCYHKSREGLVQGSIFGN